MTVMDITPNKAQYLSGEEVILLLYPEGDKMQRLKIRICHLEQIVSEILQIIQNAEEINIGNLEGRCGGYGVEVILEDTGELLCRTAFDIAKDPFSSLRYGFVSDFSAQDDTSDALNWMRKCHINLVQFYDWSYRHDHLVSKDADYQDMMGKQIHLDTVKHLIRTGHQYGMRSMAYGAVYAASEPFFESHPSWGFFHPDGKPITFIDIFYIMNLGKDSPWRAHLISQYQEAMEEMGFDGIHMDTYGFPKKAFSHLGDTPELIHLDEEFPELINETWEALKQEDREPCLIFNNVGNWPVDKTADTEQKAVYIEVWDPYERYHHLMEIIENARLQCHRKKPIILAAYLKPFRTLGISEGIRAARLLMAGIVSSGAYHLLTGEKHAVLTQGYYSDYTCLDEKSADILRSYYDFMIRYKELFYDSTLETVSMTHFGGDNFEYASEDKRLSVTAKGDKIWLILRQNKRRQVLYLINLCGNDDLWNEGKKEPKVQRDIPFMVQEYEDTMGVYMASPDTLSQRMEVLAFDTIDGAKGRFISFTVPRVNYWTVIEIRQGEG